MGVFSAALKRGALSAADQATMIASATQLNDVGRLLPEWEGVHAVTDVTGFGLLGHALELCRGSRLSGRAARGRRAAATRRRDFGSRGGRHRCRRPQLVELWRFGERGGRRWKTGSAALLCDPQTSGGLLIAVAERRGTFHGGAAAGCRISHVGGGGVDPRGCGCGAVFYATGGDMNEV